MNMIFFITCFNKNCPYQKCQSLQSHHRIIVQNNSLIEYKQRILLKNHRKKVPFDEERYQSSNKKIVSFSHNKAQQKHKMKIFGQSQNENQSPSQSSPVQAPQESSSRCLRQFNELMRDSGDSGTNLVLIRESSRVKKQEVSMLVKLEDSLGQRPSFEQLFLMEQEKKHLWELLALKQQNLQKLQAKLKEQQTKNFDIRNQLSKKDEVIHKLKQKQVNSKQRQAKLQKELKKVISIKDNIIQELNYIKNNYCQQQLLKQTNSISHYNKANHHSNQTLIPSILVPQIHTQTVQLQNQHSLRTFQQQIANLKRQNSTLTQNNLQLKISFDQVLDQLRSIKLELLQKFDNVKTTTNPLLNHPSIQPNYPNKQNIIIDNGVKTKPNYSNQKQLALKKLSQNSKNLPKNLQCLGINLYPSTNLKSFHYSLKKNKQIQDDSFQTKTSKQNLPLKSKDSNIKKITSFCRQPFKIEKIKKIDQTSNRLSLGRRDQQGFKQLQIR